MMRPGVGYIELDSKGKAINVQFKWSSRLLQEIKNNEAFTAQFYDATEGDRIGPYWRVPKTLPVCDALREIFGVTRRNFQGDVVQGLVIGPRLNAWAKAEQQKRRNLGVLAAANDAELDRITPESRIGRAIAGKPIKELKLPRLPSGKKHPLMRPRDPRPYQRADIAMMAIANVLNLNQPGTGKTIETIGSWVEADLEDGPHLVIAPVQSLEAVWMEEINMWLPELDVWTSRDPDERSEQVEGFLEAVESGATHQVLCVNHDWIRVKKIWDKKDIETKDHKYPKNKDVARRYKGHVFGFKNELQRRLFAVEFKTSTIDEFHKAGLRNRNTLFTLGAELIKAMKKAALSGTPMGGVVRTLWPPLHWIEPEQYSSEWSWIKAHLQTASGYGDAKIVQGIKDNHEEDFYEDHKHHIVRRLKLEALPGLPRRVEQIVWCKMTKKQKAQYEEFELKLEIKIDEERLSALNVLTEYMRLKQFANAMQRMEDGVPHPTEESGKLEELLERLDENGVRKDSPEPGARAIVGSESARMVHMVTKYLRSKGIDADSMVGGTDARPILERFKRGGPTPYVIVMTVQTGGVSLNLEEAGSMHAVDETWNPDDIEQFFDRGDRGERTEPLRCYVYRSRNSIQEYIAEVNEGKALTNHNVLNVRQKMQKLTMLPSV